MKDRLFGAAVLKMSFRLRGDEQSPAFKGIYPGVLRDLKKVLAGEKLSPVLVAEADIADGYHRVSLAYALYPYADVPLKLA